MNTPQVQLPGPENPPTERQSQDPNATSTPNATNSTEVTMGGTQETATSDPAPEPQDTLPDAQTEQETPALPAPKKPTPPSFLEYDTNLPLPDSSSRRPLLLETL